MARLFSIGFESGSIGSASEANGVEAFQNTSNNTPFQIDATVPRSGARCGKSPTGLGARSQISLAYTGNHFYARTGFRFSANPSTTQEIMSVFASIGGVRLHTSGAIQMVNGAGVLVATSAVLNPNVWHRLEWHVDASANPRIHELRVNGSTVATATQNVAASNGIQFWWGHLGDPGVDFFYDDIAVNDVSGSAQNSWPGDGGLYLLLPIADAQRGSWTGGAGGTTNLFAAVDNVPPAGLASASATDSSQIENGDTTDNNATDEYRATLTSYNAAGVPGGASIRVIQALVEAGRDAFVGGEAGSMSVLSNPAGASYEALGSLNTLDIGTSPVNWRVTRGSVVGSTIFYDTEPARATSPVIAIRKTDAGAGVVSVDILGLYVDAGYPDVEPDRPMHIGLRRWPQPRQMERM